MRACRKYVLVTVSSNVRASLRSSTTRGSTGCTFYLQEGVCCLLMLAHQGLDREDARRAVLRGACLAAHAPDGPGAVEDRLRDVAVADDAAVADDHGHLGRDGLGEG